MFHIYATICSTYMPPYVPIRWHKFQIDVESLHLLSFDFFSPLCSMPHQGYWTFVLFSSWLISVTPMHQLITYNHLNDMCWLVQHWILTRCLKHQAWSIRQTCDMDTSVYLQKKRPIREGEIMREGEVQLNFFEIEISLTFWKFLQKKSFIVSWSLKFRSHSIPNPWWGVLKIFVFRQEIWKDTLTLFLPVTRICVNFSTVYNDTLVAKGLMNYPEKTKVQIRSLFK